MFIVQHPDLSTEPGSVKLGILPIGSLPDIGQRSATLAEFMGFMVRRAEILIVGHLTEAWVVDGKGRDDLQGLPPSEHPDRREALIFHLVAASRQAMKVSPIERSGEAVTFDDSAELRFVDEDGFHLEGQMVPDTSTPTRTIH